MSRPFSVIGISLLLASLILVMSFIRFIHILSPLVALLAGIYSFGFLDQKLKLLFYYAFTGFCTEILVWLLLKAGVKNNTPGLHFYIMFEFLVWAIFYAACLRGFVRRKYIWAGVVLFELYCVANFVFVQDLNSYPYTRTVEDLLMISLSVLLFLKIMVDAKIEKLTRSPLIWINMAVLLYFAGNFFYNIVFVHMLVVDRIFLKTTALYIFGLFNFLFYSGIAAGFLLQAYNAKRMPELI